MKRVLILLAFLGTMLHAGAQVMVSGHVADANDGLELMGCSVAEKDATNRVVGGMTTDMNGNFAFKVKNVNNKLVFTYMGYKTQEFRIGSQRKFNVRMEDNTMKVSEVVVKAHKKGPDGTFNIPQREVSMAMTTFKMEAMEGVSVASADDALQGRVAGLDIVMGGSPGSGGQMRIRGTTSITGNSQPLVVVNGVPYSGEIDESFDFGTANEEEYADLLSVNTEDIEEITVLKDAASTAMWGSKGANGVLLIKTKRGTRGKTRVSYTYKLSGSTQPKGMKLLSGGDYTMMMKQAYFNRTLSGRDETYGQYNYDELRYEPDNQNYNNNTDWVDEVTRHGWTNDHYLTVTGGGERATFRISGGYYDKKGTVMGERYKRFSTRSQLDYHVSDRMLFTSEFQFTYSDNDRNYESLLNIAYKKMPNMSVYEQNADGSNTDRYLNMDINTDFNRQQRDLKNPVAVGELAKNDLKGYRLMPKMSLQYDFFDPDKHYLRYLGWVAIDLNNEREERFLPAECVYNAANNYGSANVAETKTSGKLTVATEHGITYQSHFLNKDHNLQAQALMQLTTTNSHSQYIKKQGLPSSEITDAITIGYISGTGNGNGNDKTLGWMGRVHYSFKGRYIVDANLRVDGSTQFGPSNRYGFFPGVGGKWIISDEPWLQKYTGKVLTLLAFRPSWGVSGRQPGKNYLQYSLLATHSSGYMDMSAVYPTRIRLDGLKWEKVTSLNLGFDMELWNGKVSVIYDWYKKRTDDLLFRDIDIPSSSGFTTLTYKNVGVMDNDGWELTVNLNKIVEKGKFSLDFNMNFASNKNMIRSLDPSVLNNFNNHSTFGNGAYYTRLQEGNSFGSIYGFRYKGVYAYSYDRYAQATAEGKTCPVARDANGVPMTNFDGTVKPMYYYHSTTKYQFQGGDAIYEDINHDGSIDQYDVVYLGNCNPKMQGGFGFTLRYDRLSVNLFCNYRWGNKIVNMARMNAENMYDAYNQCTTVNWRWRKEGDVTEMPRAVYNQGYNWLASDRYVEDGSFLRIKYITVRYRFPSNWIKRIGMNNLSAYFTMNNLWCFTKYSGVDPEISICTDTGRDYYGIAVDNSMTPRAREWTFGLSATF